MTERALALAMVRIAKLEDENASTFGGQARHIAELEATLAQERRTYASVAEQLKARIAELEAERDDARKLFNEQLAGHAAVIAERDRLYGENDRLREVQDSYIDRAREDLAALMIRHSIPTGHGDTIGDLLIELEGYLAELNTCARAALSDEGVKT